jgi:hypothetical protein
LIVLSEIVPRQELELEIATVVGNMELIIREQQKVFRPANPNNDLVMMASGISRAEQI